MTFMHRRQRVSDTDSVLQFLDIKFSHSAPTLRVVNDNQNWTSSGQDYTGYAFRFTPPDDVAGQTPRGAIEIENVGLNITADLETWLPGYQIEASLKIADSVDPNTYVVDIPLPITRVSTNMQTARAEGGADQIMRQQAMRLRYTPYVSPGIH